MAGGAGRAREGAREVTRGCRRPASASPTRGREAALDETSKPPRPSPARLDLATALPVRAQPAPRGQRASPEPATPELSRTLLVAHRRRTRPRQPPRTCLARTHPPAPTLTRQPRPSRLPTLQSIGTPGGAPVDVVVPFAGRGGPCPHREATLPLAGAVWIERTTCGITSDAHRAGLASLVLALPLASLLRAHLPPLAPASTLRCTRYQ